MEGRVLGVCIRVGKKNVHYKGRNRIFLLPPGKKCARNLPGVFFYLSWFGFMGSWCIFEGFVFTSSSSSSTIHEMGMIDKDGVVILRSAGVNR
jgi:hypothetical protein